MSTDEIPVAPNQVRRFTNKQGHPSYYIVVKEPSTGKLGALWLRKDSDEPLHVAFKFSPSKKHKLIMENVNVLRSTFERLDKELTE